MKLQVRTGQQNEVKIKLRVENKGHLPKLHERKTQEHLEKLGRRVTMMSASLLANPWRRGRINNFGEFWSLNELKEEA